MLMIDTISETLLTLAQAAESLPRRRRGRKTHISTLYRWSQSGCRGVRLETVQVGATRCTSAEALQRFFERLSHASQATGGESPPVVGGRSLAQRERQSKAAGEIL